MKAMILAAGRGERLRPLTDTLPKPLIEIGGETLIERHLRRLAAAGYREVVINVSHLGALIERRLGDGSAWGIDIAYSREPDGALETAGGIAHALPLLGDAPFLVLNADVWTDLAFDLPAPPTGGAHLVLVPNPAHNAGGDFALVAGRVRRDARRDLTYAGIGVFDPAPFRTLDAARAALAPLLFALAAGGALRGQVHHGRWYDIGTRARLAAARRAVGAARGAPGG